MSLRGIIDAMEAAKTWVVLAHVKPDGDTIGCALAVAITGRRLSKHIILACADPCPSKYEFLCGDLSFSVMNEVPSDLPKGDTVVICVDTSGADRTLGGVDGSCDHPVINIDHHIDNTAYGTHNFIMTEASSTGEVILRLLRASGWGISKEAADALYVAMTTDNGNFSYASTLPSSHLCAAKLLKAGVSPSEIADKMSASMTREAFLLWGRAFAGVDMISGGVGAAMLLDENDFRSTGASKEDTDGLVNSMLKIRGVMICALAVSSEKGAKVSIRSRSPYSARDVANLFGGGGHELAAGCTVNASPQEAISKIKQEMSAQIAARLRGDR